MPPPLVRQNQKLATPQNSLAVEFLWEKIEGNLRRANTEPSMGFRRANMEPSMDFRTANTELSMRFRRANTETYWKSNVNLSKRVGKDGVFLLFYLD